MKRFIVLTDIHPKGWWNRPVLLGIIVPFLGLYFVPDDERV